MRLFHNIFGRFRRRANPDREVQNIPKLLDGYRNTALLYVAAKLKIADLLAAGPRQLPELARTLQAHPPTLHRVMRGLVVVGFCSETDDGGFQLRPLGERFQSNTGSQDYSLAIMIGEEYANAWNHLFEGVMTGKTPFDLAFGESSWAHREKHPDLNQNFHAWLERGALSVGRAIANIYDFPAQGTVADIGGGHGALLTGLLEARPGLTGILLDQPHVIALARKKIKEVESRCRLVEGDFFEAIPVQADIHILKSILHDWDDEKCVVILKNCRRSMTPGQKLLVIEKILPAKALDRPGTILSDLHMLAVTGGRERTAGEYRDLFRAAGFEMQNVTYLKTGHSLIEVIPV